MMRKIIVIDREKCNGCGLCAKACQEGAIGMKDGKAVLLREDYCDGLGNCLPVCPTGAISFETREAKPFDEAAVRKEPPMGGCPGARAEWVHHAPAAVPEQEPAAGGSCLNQWPVQIKLVPVNAPYLENADLLIAADCTAYACGDFHRRFMKGRITLIGCPKLDEGDYSEKLTEILKCNSIKSVTVVRMEVPCCCGIARAAVNALKNCGKMIPWQAVTISTGRQILNRNCVSDLGALPQTPQTFEKA